MSWAGWVVLASLLAAIYALTLNLYRLGLSIRSLIAQAKHTSKLVEELLNYEPLQFTEARPSSAADLTNALRARKTFENDREAKRLARQRRLLRRIGNIELDKR